MNCPACQPTKSLTTHELSPGLNAHGCTSCGGEWVRLESYTRWRDTASSSSTEILTAEPVTTTDVPGLRRCPDCERILARFRIGHGATFVIERCRQCHGAWFDKNEWQSLVQSGIARRLPEVFSDEWQRSIRQEEQRAAAELMFEQRLGAREIARAREVRDWIANHSQRNTLLAYLELLPASAVRE